MPRNLDVRDRLREGMLQTLAQAGAAGVSARQLAKTAGSSPSAINYHFGGIERLFSDVQSVAINRASAWATGRLESLPVGRPLPVSALGPFLAATIDDWCRQEPELAFAWRECQTAAQRQTDMAPLAEAWTAMWHRFWQDAGAAFGLSADAGRMVAAFFDAESFLHLIDWERSVDAPAVTEICRRFAARLAQQGAHAPEPFPWRSHARRRSAAAISLPSVLPPVAETISQAILALIGEQGVVGLTHRSAALRAGATLGAVSYHFPSRADLLHAAFLAAYHNITRPRAEETESPVAVPLSPNEFCSRVVKTVIEPGPVLANVRAIDEVLLAGARDADLRAVAAYLRYSRGETTIKSVQRMPALAGQVDELDCAIISGCIGGIRRTVCTQPLERQRETAQALIGDLLTLFAMPPS